MVTCVAYNKFEVRPKPCGTLSWVRVVPHRNRALAYFKHYVNASENTNLSALKYSIVHGMNRSTVQPFSLRRQKWHSSFHIVFLLLSVISICYLGTSVN